jgi:hypothetical protein
VGKGGGRDTEPGGPLTTLDHLYDEFYASEFSNPVGVIHPGLWTPVADIQFRHRRTWFASDAGEGPFIEWITDADEMEPQRGGAPIPGEVRGMTREWLKLFGDLPPSG